MTLQHVNVKLLLDPSVPLDLEAVIPVFHQWIQERVAEELLLDVADYRHVPDGPGVVLIGHEANYSIDNTGGRLGVRYNRKAPLDGSAQDRLRQAARAAVWACRRLATDPSLEGKVRYDGRHLELFVNDRLLAPNSDATRQALDPEFRAFLGRLFADGPYTLQHEADSRRLFSLLAESSDPFTPDDLWENLND